MKHFSGISAIFEKVLYFHTSNAYVHLLNFQFCDSHAMLLVCIFTSFSVMRLKMDNIEHNAKSFVFAELSHYINYVCTYMVVFICKFCENIVRDIVNVRLIRQFILPTCHHGSSSVSYNPTTVTMNTEPNVPSIENILVYLVLYCIIYNILA